MPSAVTMPYTALRPIPLLLPAIVWRRPRLALHREGEEEDRPHEHDEHHLVDVREAVGADHPPVLEDTRGDEPREPGCSPAHVG
jgi:hypothetical protein